MKLFPRIGILGFGLGLAICLLAGCGDRDDSILSIERSTRVVKAPVDRHDGLYGWEEMEGGLYRARFHVPPTFLVSYSSSEPDDPFAAPKPPVRRSPNEAKEILENAGVVFGDGASATYNPKTSILTVVQTQDQMELVEAYCEGGCYTPERQIHISAEIYQLPAFAGVEVLESIRSQGEHSPERESVLRAAREGDARLLAAPAVLARSGQRAKTEELVSVPREPVAGEGDEGENPEPASEDIPILSFEVDPVLGADNFTVDLNFQITLRDREDLDSSRTIMTQVTLHDGDRILVGNWNAGETGEMILVFVTATIQTLGDHGELIESAEEKSD